VFGEWRTRTLLRLKALFRRRQLDRDLDDELAFHVAMREQKLSESVAQPDDAHYAVRRRFGNATSLKESTREMWTFTWLETLWQDVRYGARVLRKSPGFTATAVLTLALGIGANTAIFTVVNSVLLRPLPYKDPSHLYWVSDYLPRFHAAMVGSSDYLAWRERNAVFDDMAAYNYFSTNLTTDGEPERLSAVGVTASFFSMLGVEPAIGRAFVDAENRAGVTPVVILSYRFWQQRYAGSQNILGRSIHLDDSSYQAVGVMPADFRFPDNDRNPDLYLPLTLPPHPIFSPQSPQQILQVLARVKPGIRPERAISDLATMNEWIARQYPAAFAAAASNTQVQFINLHDRLIGDTRPGLLMLLGAVSFLLLISCANVANLQLARSSRRQREIAVRMALGAGRSRVVRQLLTENVLLAVIAALLGFFIAREGIQLFHVLPPSAIPHPEFVVMDGWVLGFTMVIAIVTGLLFGLAPASVTFHADLNYALKEGTSGSGTAPGRIHLRGMLVVAELAMALVVMVGAGLLINSFMKLMAVSPGFDSHNLFTAQLKLSSVTYKTQEQQGAFASHLLETITGLPGVKSAALGTSLPMMPYDSQNAFFIKGQPEMPIGTWPLVPIIDVTPGYFQALGIPVLSGRPFAPEDRAGSSPVAIVNRAFVNQYLNGVDPMQQSLRISGSPTAPWTPIVGLVGDERHQGPDVNPSPQIYIPLVQSRLQYIQIALRTQSNPAAVASELKYAVQQLDPNLPVYDVSTMDQRLAKSVGTRKFDTLMLGIFAAVALIVAAVGVYGVVSYAVSQRIHEFGIRIALGATPSDVLRLVLGQGLRLALMGVLIGVLGALALTRLLAGMLFEIKPSDPFTLASVAVLLSAVALLACYIPARRATRVDPMFALRHE
jgi:predicted permease